MYVANNAYLSKLHAAQRGAQNGSPQITLVGHKYTVQRIPRNLDDIPAEGVDDVHQVRVVAVNDLLHWSENRSGAHSSWHQAYLVHRHVTRIGGHLTCIQSFASPFAFYF